jgi:hypothetical protein
MLARDAAAIAGERRIGADDPMAGNDNADGVGPVGHADRAHRLGAAKLRGEAAIGRGCAYGDGAQSRPDLALKRGATGLDLQRVERRERAGIVSLQGAARG